MVCLTQLLFELQVVFNNSVVHHDDASGAIAMRMGVFFCRPAVRCPAGVTYAVGTVERAAPNNFLKVETLSLGAAYFERMSLVYHRDACRGVTAILELTQAVNDQRHNLLVPHVANNSAHKFFL